MSDRGGVGSVVGGERRLLTVMFGDLVGSTAMSAQLDPEDYAEVVLTFHQAARRAVEQHGGVVAQFLGDGVVAEFGYPVAHENDAERAIESAIELQREMATLSSSVEAEFGVTLRCRIGIHTGLTVVGRTGSGPDSDVAMFGTTANVAARVQAEADPGEIYVTNDTLGLLTGRYAVDADRSVTLRGIDEPMTIARVLGRAESADGIQIGDLVARAVERDALLRRWDRACGGQGGAVLIVGPSGVGKSTLLDTLRSGVPSGDRIETRARELTALSPFSTIGELATVCSRDPALAPAAADVDRAIGDIGRNAEQARHIVMERCADLGTALGRHARLIVVEDVHWLDPSSREALGVIASCLEASSSLLVATSRNSGGFADTIDLAPLAAVDARRLVESAAAGHDLAPAIIDEIVRRAGGVPLYLVALTDAACAGRSDQLPASLQSSLLARIDRVPSIRRACQIASVIGDPLDQDLLTAILTTDHSPDSTIAVPPGVEAMRDAGLLVTAPDGQLLFSHALLREAVYESLLQKDRRRLHRHVADVLDARGAQHDERIGLVAHHLERANEPRLAARALATAARRSARRGADREAIALAQRGLALTTDEADVALHLLMTKGNATFAVDGYGADGLLELWQNAERLAQQCDNRIELSSAMNGQAVVALFAGQYALSAQRAERIVGFGQDHDDRPALVRGHCSLALAQLWAGDCGDALHHARRAIELYADGDDELLTYGFGTDHLVIACSAGGMAAWCAADIDAEALLLRGIDHAERIESPISLCTALQQAAVVELLSGRLQAAVARSDALIATAERFNLTFFAELGRMTRATARCQGGEVEAFEQMMTALTGLMAGTSQLGVTVGLLHLALCQEACGQGEAAASTARFGLDLASERGEWLFEVELASVMARCTGHEAAWSRLADAATRADERGAPASAGRARAAIAASASPQ